VDYFLGGSKFTDFCAYTLCDGFLAGMSNLLFRSKFGIILSEKSELHDDADFEITPPLSFYSLKKDFFSHVTGLC
jgi:hypothetical protein